ncbi:MAG: NDP-hexose 2,3-dehydratase family protein, partial [Myxococcota bacterium]|nr:NDP-hexose 2,3-dehydratase family protein [Myxococcota bacterium]
MNYSRSNFTNISGVPKLRRALVRSLCGFGNAHSLDHILSWLNHIRDENAVHIEPTSFSKLRQWYLDEDTGTLRHRSGGFFRIEGIQVKTTYGQVHQWEQPIVNQPEIGFLGVITKIINGTLHFLLQAKIEPGNINTVQISPTLQATKSNYLKKHKGRSPKYLEYFQSPEKNIILDQLQSEQGARFLRKRNRNIIIYIEDDIEVEKAFCWVTLHQVCTLSQKDNTVNMDTRTVLSGLQYGNIADDLSRDVLTPFKLDILKSEQGGKTLFSLEQIISWI